MRIIVYVLFLSLLTLLYSSNTILTSYPRYIVPNDHIIFSVSDAPLAPANLRILVVTKDGSGDYTTIQAAVDNSKPGDTIQVKDGVYIEGVLVTKSGTSSQPITIMNYPGNSPVIDPGGGKYSNDMSRKVELRAEWIILEGFEIRYGQDGVKVTGGHNTIRGNWIHHSQYQGILGVNSNDLFIVTFPQITGPIKSREIWQNNTI